MIIYKVVNIINCKVYIGQTTRTLEQRRKEHITNCDRILYNAFKKHGVENFKWEIIEDNVPNKTQLNLFEQMYIIINNSICPFGYNMTYGGEGCQEHCVNSKLKMSYKKKQSWADEDSKYNTEEYKQKHREKALKQKLEGGFTPDPEKEKERLKGNCYWKLRKENKGGRQKGFKQTPEHIAKRFAKYRNKEE